MRAPLSQTSAFVLACDKGYSYKNAKAKEFLSHLDLSEGEKMRGKTLKLQPRLDESIRNRKFFIHNFIRERLRANPSTQVVVLACGWDPMLLEMSGEFPHSSFFGIDSESVDLQTRLVKKAAPQAPVFYIRADIADSRRLIEGLSAKGWQKSKPSCLVVEGISYYIPPDIFWGALKGLKREINPDGYICGDFLVDDKKISPSAQAFAQSLFGFIKEVCHQDCFSFDPDEIRARLGELGFSRIQLFSQDEIQNRRAGNPSPWGAKDSHVQFFMAQGG